MFSLSGMSIHRYLPLLAWVSLVTLASTGIVWSIRGTSEFLLVNYIFSFNFTIGKTWFLKGVSINFARKAQLVCELWFFNFPTLKFITHVQISWKRFNFFFWIDEVLSQTKFTEKGVDTVLHVWMCHSMPYDANIANLLFQLTFLVPKTSLLVRFYY